MFLRQRVSINGVDDVQLDTSHPDYALLLAEVGTGVIVNYIVVSQDRLEYERGTGTVSAGGVFARATVTSSSNANALVNFGPGSHQIHIEEQGVGAVAAEDVSYDNTTSGLAATDVQAAIDELAAKPPGIEANAGWYVRDNFIGYRAGVSQNDVWQFTSNGGLSATSVDSAYPGSFLLSTATASTNAPGILYARSPGDNPTFAVGGGEINVVWYVRTSDAPTLAQDYFFRIGCGTTVGEGTNGIYFTLTPGGPYTHWTAICRASSVSTTMASPASIAVASNTNYKLQIVINAAGTSVDFYVNDVLLGTMSSGIPTAGLTFICQIAKATGATARTLRVLAFEAWQRLTTPY